MAYSELVKNFNGNSISMALRVGKSIGEKVPAPMMMNVGV